MYALWLQLEALQHDVAQLGTSHTAANSEYHRQVVRNLEELELFRQQRAKELAGMVVSHK